MTMKFLSKSKKGVFLLLCLVLTVLSSCDTNDDSPTDREETQEEKETKLNLVGDWKLVSSKIDGVPLGAENFAFVKESYAIFNSDNTYELVYVKNGNNGSSSTSKFSGTYAIESLNRVKFYNSPSVIEFINPTIQITSTNTENKTQVDIFIRSDNEEFNSENDNPIDLIDNDDDESINPDDSFDGSEIITKILGIWQIEGAVDNCQKKNTIEFKTSDLLILTQHKSKFNRIDLIRHNVNVSYPIPKIFSATVTKGFNTVIFDTEAECNFVKVNEIHYTVTDALTIKIKEAPQLTIKIVSDTEILLIHKYEDENSNEQKTQYSFKKSMV